MGNDAKTVVAGGCLMLLGYVAFIALVVWIIATIIFNVFN